MKRHSNNFDSIKKLWHSELLEPKISHISSLIKSNPLLNQTLLMQDTAMAVLDISTFKYVGLWGEMVGLLGWDESKLYEGGVEFYVSNFPHEDFLGFEIISKCINDYVVNLSPDEIKKLKIVFDYKFVRGDGQLIRINQESIVLDSDNLGRIVYYLALASDITHLKKDGKQHFSFTIGNDILLYEVNNEVNEYTQIEALSKREIEVIKLLGKKFTSEQIAEKLYISTHTVNTHRQKILKKTKMGDTMEVINLLKLHHII